MRAKRAVWVNAKGVEQTRLLFPQWELPDGQVLMNVSIHPHLCGTCSGGDHTHVEINDEREPLRVIDERVVVFSAQELRAINALLLARLGVDGLTKELERHLH